MSFQQNAFQHNALQTGVAAGSAPVQLDGGDEFGWLGLQSVIGGVVLAAAALVSGNAQSQTVKHQDEVPYVTGNPIGYGQPYTQRAQVKPVFIQMGTGDELPISAAPNFVDDTTPPVFSPKIEIPLPAPVWDDPQLCRILVEENEWGNPFVVPQIVVAPTFGHHDELGTTPAAPILEEPWKPPVLSLEGPKWLDSPDELIVPQPAPTIREDDYWLGCPTFLPEAIRAVWDSQDEILPSIRDEEPWMGASYPLGPVVQVSDYSDDIVPQPPTAISVEETYWIQPDPPRDVVTSWQFQTDVNEDFPELSEPPVIPEEPRVINLAPGWPLRFLVYINGKPHYGTQEEIDELLEELAEKDAEKPKKTRTRIVVQQGKPIFEKVPAPNKTQLLQFQSNFRDHYLKAYAKYKLEEDDEDDWLLLL